MKTKTIKNLEHKLLKISEELGTMKSLSRILLECLYDGSNLKQWDAQSLAAVLDGKIYYTKKLFGAIERKLGI